MRSMLLFILMLGAECAFAQRRERPMLPGPFRRRVRIHEVYKPKGYPNLLTANVPQLIAINNVYCIGGGIACERFLDKKGLLSAGISAYACAGNDHVATQLRESVTYHNGNAFYLAPGFSVHPLGNAGRIDFSIGAQYAIGSFHEERLTYKGLGHVSDGTDDFTVSMPLLQGDLNLNTPGHFVLGFHIAGGPSLSSDLKQSGMFQAGLKLGARF